jgi:hypothetical protein
VIERSSVTILHEFALHTDVIPDSTLDLTPKAIGNLDDTAEEDP